MKILTERKREEHIKASIHAHISVNVGKNRLETVILVKEKKRIQPQIETALVSADMH